MALSWEIVRYSESQVQLGPAGRDTTPYILNQNVHFKISRQFGIHIKAGDTLSLQSQRQKSGIHPLKTKIVEIKASSLISLKTLFHDCQKWLLTWVHNFFTHLVYTTVWRLRHCWCLKILPEAMLPSRHCLMWYSLHTSISGFPSYWLTSLIHCNLSPPYNFSRPLFKSRRIF